ncbi:MAG TPA: glycosyltransferase [Dehalococcoidia bacterium]|jgi:glycosyltransferase involved in cell wall biosynthesis
MRRLTVLLLVNDLRIGGAERQLAELARGLDQERFRVIVATLYAGQPFENDVRDCAGVELRSLNQLGNRLGKFDFLTLFKLVRLLRREKVDIIQPFLTPATAFGMLAAIIARTPVKIVSERCGVRLNTHLGNKLYRFFEDRLTRFADAVVPHSEAGRRYVRSRGIASEKVRVIYNGVAPERVNTTLAERQAIRAEYGVLDESWLIGIAASLTPANDHASFLQAASIVRAEVPGTKFLLAGDGPLRAELMRRAAVLGLNGSVIFAGHQMRVAPYIGAMDVAVLSSCDHEGCSNFLLEAMGLGRSIVTTDAGGNEELFPSGEAGLIVPPSNPLILAHAILEIMRHPDAAEQMQRRSREIFRQRFTLATMIAEYEDLYADLWRAYEPEQPPAAETERAA